MFPFTFKLPVPGLNPFAQVETPSEAPPNPGYASQSPEVRRSRPARPNNVHQRRPSPSPSPAPITSRKRGWDPSLAEPSQSTATLASSSGYLDTPAKYRDMVGQHPGDEYEVEEMAMSVAEMPPPAKRRRGLAGSIVSTAVSAALIGTAVGLTVYRLWRDRGKDPEPEALPPPPYQKGEWSPSQQPQIVEITPPTPIATPRRRKVRHTGSASATKRHNQRARPRAHARAYSPPSSTMSPPRTPFDSNAPEVEPSEEVEDKARFNFLRRIMDWIGDQLSMLIATGKKALATEIVVKSDSREDEVDDGSGAWEEEEGGYDPEFGGHPSSYHSSLSRSASPRQRMRPRNLTLAPTSYASRPSSQSPRATRFEFTSASLPSAAARWRPDAPGNIQGVSTESLNSRQGGEEPYESAELRESMSRARANARARLLGRASVQRCPTLNSKCSHLSTNTHLMTELPAELYLYIASFIPDDELFKFVGVNLHFYNLVLNLRYNTIRIESVNATTQRLLQRLRDPAVAHRVRRLAVRPTAGFAKVEPANERRERRPRAWYKSILMSSVVQARKAPPPPPPSVEDTVDSLIVAFPGFTNLTTFEVEAWDLSAGYDLQGFFRPAWSAFGPQLETLSVAGRPETFKQFVASAPQLASCTTLSLQFTHELDTMTAVADEILANSVAPFINSLAPRLQVLKIWSWSTLDLSSLFLALRHLPRLHDFHLRAPFNKAFSDPAGLTALLKTNAATLDTIELRLNPTGSATDPDTQESLGRWFSSLREHPAVLANLKLLRMYPTTLSSGFDALVMYIERSANTLTTLAVKDRYLNLDEVEALVAPLCHRAPDEGLEALRLNVRVWNAQLFFLLHSKLPGLKSLSLYIGESHPHRATTDFFFQSMQEHSFASWKLRDIGLWQGGFEVPAHTMQRLAACIPSVTSFWQNGHMQGDIKIYG
ncbi:hypothetical protein R3P38DRAFT_3393117 [Favolaschia claudopus]|uniref:F-box domain-containing protein n=1 Tax=Favolaschia claudopus TaxID=2862362 RepID=A0AAW0C462_9AGAR